MSLKNYKTKNRELCFLKYYEQLKFLKVIIVTHFNFRENSQFWNQINKNKILFLKEVLLI